MHRLFFPLFFVLFHINHAENEVFDRVFEIMTDKNRQRVFEYTSIFEVIDAIVNDTCHKFPELTPPTDEDVILLKRQFVHFVGAGPTVQDEVMAGFPSKFNLISKKIKQLREIAKREFPKLDEELRKRFKDEDKYLEFYVFINPVHKLLVKNIESYEKRGLNKRQIKDEIKKREHELMDLWHEDDPEGPNYEMYQARKRWKNMKNEL